MRKYLFSKSFLALLGLVLISPVLPTRAESPAPSGAAGAAPDMMLLEEESKFEREKTDYLQQNVLDKILGPGKAVVIVDVEMGMETRGMEMESGKKKNEKKANEGENGEPQPVPPAKVLVPGVPMPKSVFPTEQEDLGGNPRAPAVNFPRSIWKCGPPSRNF